VGRGAAWQQPRLPAKAGRGVHAAASVAAPLVPSSVDALPCNKVQAACGDPLPTYSEVCPAALAPRKPHAARYTHHWLAGETSWGANSTVVMVVAAARAGSCRWCCDAGAGVLPCIGTTGHPAAAWLTLPALQGQQQAYSQAVFGRCWFSVARCVIHCLRSMEAGKVLLVWPVPALACPTWDDLWHLHRVGC
jgi:hypothetical protein